jgi:hypothetical protein
MTAVSNFAVQADSGSNGAPFAFHPQIEKLLKHVV